MKNKIVAFAGLIVMVVLISSCATSRKYGCPTASKPQIEKKNFQS